MIFIYYENEIAQAIERIFIPPAELRRVYFDVNVPQGTLWIDLAATKIYVRIEEMPRTQLDELLADLDVYPETDIHVTWTYRLDTGAWTRELGHHPPKVNISPPDESPHTPF